MSIESDDEEWARAAEQYWAKHGEDDGSKFAALGDDDGAEASAMARAGIFPPPPLIIRRVTEPIPFPLSDSPLRFRKG
jgi:hypothetical protein